MEPSFEILKMIYDAKKGDFDPLKKHMIEHDMGPLYRTLCNKHVLPDEPRVYCSILEKNEAMLRKISEKQKESEKKLDCRERLEYFARIGDLVSFLEESGNIGLSTSAKMDVILCQIRLAIIIKDFSLVHEKMDVALQLSKKDCDWDRKNRFKVYYALYNMLKGNYHEASSLFASSLATFQCTELFSYETAVSYTIFCGLLSFNRTELSNNILKSTDVLEVRQRVSLAYDLVQAIYNGSYDQIFTHLVAFSSFFLDDVFIGSKMYHFISEIKVKSYKQLLESYSSISIKFMATAFRVSEEYLESDLSKFLINERIKCVIDKVDGMVLIKESSETLYDKVDGICDKVLNYIEQEINK